MLSWAYEQPEMNSLTFLFVDHVVGLVFSIVVPSSMLMRIFTLSFFFFVGTVLMKVENAQH